MSSGSSRQSEQVVSVFVRVRPLTSTEIAHDASEFKGLQLRSSEVEEPTANAYAAAGAVIGGFTGILGQEALNQNVFERALAPQLQTVLRGGTASCFCYGYTGSGKTHTVIGYGQEKGLYYLAAERLLQELGSVSGDPSDKDNGLFLRVTMCEMYNDEVFDLLGPSKLLCTLRVDDQGQLQVLGPQTSVALEESESGILQELFVPEDQHAKAPHAELVTRVAGLRSALVLQPEDLEAIRKTCVTQRAVGSSTEHAQSSRSHAILRMEVVNQAVLDAQTALDEAKALVPSRKNAVDNVNTGMHSLLYESYRRVLGPPLSEGEKESRRAGEATNSCDGSYIIVSGDVTGYKLQGHEEEGLKTAVQWANHFGVLELVPRYELPKRVYEEPGKWDAIQQALLELKPKVTKLLANAEAEVVNATQELERVRSCGPAPLGGSLLLVDLAGADYDHRSGMQQKDSAAINKSLLAIKECLRSLAKASSAKPKFRDSKLTRLLEDSLAPMASSSRRNLESVSVMLVNVSPAESLEKMTLNTLRYGQMFATAGKECGAAKKSDAAAEMIGNFKLAGPYAAPVRSCNLEIREELLSLYREHCPAKSETEVKAILQRFAGRETELLEKARAKYVGGA
jgi:hypothetical protein